MKHWPLQCVLLLGAGMALLASAAHAYSALLIPCFNVPYMHTPPVIDGRINPEEWREAAQVTGVVQSSSLQYKDRAICFWVGWDAKHLYIAARSDVLPGTRLARS